MKQKGIFKEDLSVQHPVSCGFLTEGCNGGWGILQGYFAQQGGVMPESCAMYKGGETKCSSHSICEPVARVTKVEHWFPNGEDDIKRELLLNGAVQTSWNPPAAFEAYSSGVLRDFSKSASLAQTAKKNRNGKPAHSSLIIGWTTEMGIPVWIVRNTHGSHFGMMGDVYIPRG